MYEGGDTAQLLDEQRPFPREQRLKQKLPKAVEICLVCFADVGLLEC